MTAALNDIDPDTVFAHVGASPSPAPPASGSGQRTPPMWCPPEPDQER